MVRNDSSGQLRSDRRETPDMIETRKVQAPSDSLFVNLPRYSVKKVGFEKGDEVEIELYDDRVVIRPEGSDA
jgi:hypothetical protein